jgi:hypothetical protein
MGNYAIVGNCTIGQRILVIWCSKIWDYGCNSYEL